MNLTTPQRAVSALPVAVRALALSTCLLSGWAVAATSTEPEGVMTLSASATADVPQDWMTLVFSVTRDGSDAQAVQTQLKQAVDAALTEGRRVAKPGQLEVSTTGFSIQPRYNQKGQVSGWQGSSELLVQGRDMAAIGQLTGKVSTMSIARVGYSLSREAREQAEGDLTAQAIARFRSRAAEQTRQFGYGSYAVRDVHVNVESSARPVPMLRMAMAKSGAAEDMALPVEAGKGTVTVSVNGSVQMK